MATVQDLTPTVQLTPSVQKSRKSPILRSVRLVAPETPLMPAVVSITVGKQSDTYLVQRIGSDWGDGFRVLKTGCMPEAEAYHVHLSNEGHTCDCKGFERWQHCKHSAALVALRNHGKI